MFTHIYTYTLRIYIYTSTCIHKHMYIYTHAHTHVSTYIHIYALAYIYIYIYIHTHTHTYTYMHIHIQPIPPGVTPLNAAYKAQSLLERPFSPKRGKRDVRALSLEPSKMTPQVGPAVRTTHDTLLHSALKRCARGLECTQHSVHSKS